MGSCLGLRWSLLWLLWCPLGIFAGLVAVLLALVAKCGAVALFVGGLPLGWLAAFVAVCARLGVLALLHLWGSFSRVFVQ